MRNSQKQNIAIFAVESEIPPNPKTAATIDRIKNMTATLSI
jgi:hypothetical protein